MNVLKALQHDNVVQLLAFHEQCCPEMYITEDYSHDLQATLVNKSKNGHWLTTGK
jgi:hypothetical protein